MGSTEVLTRSNLCCVIFISLFLVSSCRQPADAHVEPCALAVEIQSREMAQTVHEPETKLVEVKEAVDLLEQSHEVSRLQVLEQKRRLEGLSKKSNDIHKQIAELRWELILKRYDQLQKLAKRRKWTEVRIPKKNSPDRDAYMEWRYLKKYIEEKLRHGPPDILPPLSGIDETKSHPSEHASKRSEYQPEWMKRWPE